MSQIPPSDLPEGLGPIGDEPQTGVTRRAASVTLRRQSDVDADVGTMMDPATKSLADALAITYRILIVAIILLGVIFLFSGFKKINEFESGVKLTFGRKAETNLPPGFVFTWPEPVGELVRVQTGPRRLELRDAFFPSLTESENQSLTKDGVQSLANGGSDSLDPSSDGHLLTSDGNIAHTRWSVSYVRANAGEWAERIIPESEEALVRNVVRRAVVESVANVTMDELLRSDTGQGAAVAPTPAATTPAPEAAPAGNTPAGEGEGERAAAATPEAAPVPPASPAAAEPAPAARGSSSLRSKVERMAEESAQRELDRLDSGIRIDRLTLTVKIPPRRVMSKYNEVLSAQSKASTEIEKARKDASQTLIQAAGEAAPILLGLIDRYELEIGEGAAGAAKAEATLKQISSVLMNEPVTIDGVRVEGKTFGDATTMIEQAREYRSRIVNEVGRDVSLYNTKYEVFQANPLVAVTTEWTEAYKVFLSQPQVQTIFLPSGTDQLVVQINRDPAIAKEQESKALEEEAKKAQEERLEELRRARFSATPSGG